MPMTPFDIKQKIKAVKDTCPWWKDAIFSQPGSQPVCQQHLLNDCYNPGIILVSKDTLY